MEIPEPEPETATTAIATAPETGVSRVGTGFDWSTLDWDEIFDWSERVGGVRILNPNNYDLDLD